MRQFEYLTLEIGFDGSWWDAELNAWKHMDELGDIGWEIKEIIQYPEDMGGEHVYGVAIFIREKPPAYQWIQKGFVESGRGLNM